MKKKLTILIIIFCICFGVVIAQEKLTIAVLDFSANGPSIYAAKAVSNFINTELAKNSQLTIVEREQLDSVLSEQKLQLSGFTDNEYAVKIGSILTVQKIVIGTLVKTGSVYTITAKTVDVETGVIDATESERYKEEEDLELASRIIAVKLGNQIAGTDIKIPFRTYYEDESRNRFSLSIMPRVGFIPNVKVPVISSLYYNNIPDDEDLKEIILKSTELDYLMYTLTLAAGYEFSDKFNYN